MGQIVDRAIFDEWHGPKVAGLNSVDKFSQEPSVYIYPAEPRYMLWKVLFFYHSPYGSETQYQAD